MENKADRPMQDLKPTVWIGRQGCTATMIEEIVVQLKKRRIVKVKWLQNTDVDPEAVAREAKAVLVEVRGRTMVLQEKGRERPAPGGPKKGTDRAPAQKTARSLVKSRRPGAGKPGREDTPSRRGRSPGTKKPAGK